MSKLAALVFPLLFACTSAAAAAPRSFDGLSCTSDIEKSLVGRDLPDEPVVKTEGRYKALALKNLGGYEITDTLFLAFWQACGDEYGVLQAGTKVKAALRLGKHGEGNGAMVCHPTDATKTDVYVAAPGGRKTKGGITADRAWRIDAKAEAFAPVTSGPLECAPEDE